MASPRLPHSPLQWPIPVGSTAVAISSRGHECADGDWHSLPPLGPSLSLAPAPRYSAGHRTGEGEADRGKGGREEEQQEREKARRETERHARRPISGNPCVNGPRDVWLKVPTASSNIPSEGEQPQLSLLHEQPPFGASHTQGTTKAPNNSVVAFSLLRTDGCGAGAVAATGTANSEAWACLLRSVASVEAQQGGPALQAAREAAAAAAAAAAECTSTGEGNALSLELAAMTNLGARLEVTQ